MWFRVAKVGTRSINQYFLQNTSANQYIYSSPGAFYPALSKSFFKFAFVRNPEDRFLSAFKNKVLQNNMFSFNSEELNKYQDVNNFVEYITSIPPQHQDEHFKPQYHMIPLEHLDFLGRFESFSEDLKEVFSILGINYNTKIHNNRSAKSPVTLNEKSRSRIANYYRLDYQIFGY